MNEKHWIDEAAIKAVRSYLRVCTSGGMPIARAELVMRAIEEAASLGYFSVSVAEALVERDCAVTARNEET